MFWYFVVRFLVTTGARVSELTQIKVEHLNCGYLDLYSKGGKIRRIYITNSLCNEALKWCHERGQTSGFLFLNKNGRPVTVRGIHSRLKHFAVCYGIDPDTVYPHSFRHRFAKNFLERRYRASCRYPRTRKHRDNADLSDQVQQRAADASG